MATLTNEEKKTIFSNDLKEIRNALKTKIINRLALADNVENGVIHLDDLNASIYVFLELSERIMNLDGE